jgi:hypothetical protein
MKVRNLDDKQADIARERAETWDRAFGSGRKGGAYQARSDSQMSEWHVHIKVCGWLKRMHPSIRFYSTLDGFDLGKSNVFRSSISWFETGVPDLFIFAQRNGFSFLVLELKKKGARTQGSQHLVDQEGWLDYFRSIGAQAMFSSGYEETINNIEKYLHENKKQSASNLHKSVVKNNTEGFKSRSSKGGH